MQLQLHPALPIRLRRWLSLGCALVAAGAWSTPRAAAGSLTGSTNVLRNVSINLTTNGTLDWVHWGLYTETSINRKAGVVPQISDFAPLDNTNGFVEVYHYADNQNGYTWTDGDPVAGVTNTTTGVWAYGLPLLGTGFQITAPAGLTTRTLKVYCGAYSGLGRFEARLSDESAPAYLTTFGNPLGNGPSREVTLHYAANSDHQHITVRWTLAQQSGPGASSANVTLQAAALAAEGVNNPPVVRITSPAADANIAAPADLSLTATASDPDGSVVRVEFFVDGLKVGEDSTSPFSAAWNNPAPGRYTLTAVVTDNGGETTTSSPVAVTVYRSGGSLVGSLALPPQAVNLTTEGTADWQHWGLSPSNVVNRKAGITPLLGGLELVGAGELRFYGDNYTAFSWVDGTPTVAAGPAPNGVFVIGLGQGFTFRAPADSSTRRLRVYAGLYGALGHFEAWLTDFSAPTYFNHSLSNFFGNDYGVFTLDYAAGGPGESLIVRYVADRLFDADFGNVTLQAATLAGGGIPWLPVQILPPELSQGRLIFSFQTQAARSYEIQARDGFADGAPWQTLSTVPGTGGLVTVTNQTTPFAPRFYRVETR